MFAGLNTFEDIIGTFLFNAFEFKQLLACQAVEVWHTFDVTHLYQLRTHLLTNGVDIHRTTRDKVNDAFEIARRALLVWTIGHGLVWNA